MALTGSPMSACTAAFAAILDYPSAAIDIMKISIPACIVGVIAGALSVWKMGKELSPEEDYFKHLEEAGMSAAGSPRVHVLKPHAKTAVFIFGLAILAIVFCGSFPQLLPKFAAGADNFSVKADGSLKMVTIIEIITLTATAAIILLTKTSPAEVAKASLFTSMAAALVSVFGVVWMSATFIAHNQAELLKAMGTITSQYPLTFTFAVFIMAALMFSQAATTRAMMPLGLALGIAHPSLIAMFPAVNSDFVLPGYPTLLAAINFDRSGTTKIGKFVINHSFMRPGLVGIGTAVIVGFLLTSIFM
jgi:anaerobic C4-dicarboxylate transporter DcuA